jgi:hypothetical protein
VTPASGGDDVDIEEVPAHGEDAPQTETRHTLSWMSLQSSSKKRDYWQFERLNGQQDSLVALSDGYVVALTRADIVSDRDTLIISTNLLAPPSPNETFFDISHPGLSPTDHKYMFHFTNHVVHLLPSKASTIMSLTQGSDLALRAAMAVSAANLANIQGQYSSSRDALEAFHWASDRRHRINALGYAGEALSMATSHQSLDVIVATHLMLSFVELELGTYEGLQRYLSSVDKLIYKTSDELLRGKHGREILCGLVYTRSRQRFIAGPSNVRSRQTQIDRFWENLEGRFASTPAVLQKISYSASVALERLCLLTTLRHDQAIPAALRELVIKCLVPFSKTGDLLVEDDQVSQAGIDIASRECLEEIGNLSGQLLALAPPSGLSIPNWAVEGGFPNRECSLFNHHDEPLLFENHDQAMTAADYVFCQILCDPYVMQSVIKPSHDALTTGDSLYWLHMLIRIARGLNPSDCTNRNIYRRGICSMLMHSAVRCVNADAMVILEELLERIILRGCHWEDAMFPNIVSIPLIKALRTQLERGRTLLMASTLKEDFDLNFTIMSNRFTHNLLVHGWEADGHLFDESIQLTT